jgi:hypothetical protein
VVATPDPSSPSSTSLLGADPHERDADLDTDLDDDEDAIRHRIHELLCRRDTEGTTAGGGIPITG